MSPEQRIDYAANLASSVFPEAQSFFEGGFSHSWVNDPWAKGCAAYLRPGDETRLLPHLAMPESRLHFAGEHTASLPFIGFMQGAIESGLRAAREVNAA
jgi:monoamine oxidase